MQDDTNNQPLNRTDWTDSGESLPSREDRATDPETTGDEPEVDGFDVRRRDVMKAAGGMALMGGLVGGFGQPVRAASHPLPTRLLPNDPTEGAVFGREVALDDSGTRALVAAPGLDAAYVFDLDGGSWSQTRKFSGIDGGHVALDDSGTVAVAEPNVYTFDGNDWSEAATLKSGAVSLSADGTTALVGTGSSGDTVEVFTKSGGSWSSTATLVPDDPGNSAQFGWDVALDADGTTAVVSDNRGKPEGRGAVYVFESSGGTWSQTTKLQPSQLGPQDAMGRCVGINATGETILVGATEYLDSTQAGAVYAFELDGGSWTFVEKLTAPDPQPLDQFAWDVALSDDGTTALVGEHGDDTKVKEGGAVHVYSYDGSEWSHDARLAPTDPSKDEQLGISVSLDAGTTVLSGAFGYEDDVDNGGAAYVFDLAATTPSAVVSDLRPVQVVENTVLRDPNGSDESVSPRTPDLVDGRPTTVLFDLEGSESLADLPAGATVDVTVRRLYANRSAVADTFQFDKSELVALADSSTDEAEFFGDASRSDRLPVFDLDGDLETIVVEVGSDADGDGNPDFSGGARRVDLDTAPYDVQSMGQIDVGFIELADPDGGANYGDSNGRIKDDFDTLVDEITDFLDATYPVEGVVAHVHPERLDDPSVLDTSGGALVEDLKSAHSALVEEFSDVDLDATVAIVPEGFPEFHDDGWFGFHPGALRAAAGVRGDLRADISLTELQATSSQEVGHHFFEDYPDDLSMRQSDGDIDNAHARTEPGSGNSTPDDKFIDSTGFDLRDGELSLVGTGLNSFMSYSFTGQLWADTFVFQTMIDTDLEQHAAGDRSGGKVPVLEGVARFDGNDEATLTRLFRFEGYPGESHPGEAVTVTVLDGNGDTIGSQTVPDELEVHRRVPNIDDSSSVLSDVAGFEVPFPQETAAVELERDGTVTRLNPVEQTLRDAFDRLPDAAFVRSPDDRRAAFDDKLDAIEEMMSKEKYRPAKNKLRRDVRDKVEKWLRDDYETTALQPTKTELLAVVDEMIDRLTALAQQR